MKKSYAFRQKHFSGFRQHRSTKGAYIVTAFFTDHSFVFLSLLQNVRSMAMASRNLIAC